MNVAQLYTFEEITLKNAILYLGKEMAGGWDWETFLKSRAGKGV